MLLEEFIKLTDVIPTEEEYKRIEEQYYAFDGEKDQFCREFIKNECDKKLYQERAEKIHSLERKLEDILKEKEKETGILKENIRKLEEQLDKELEWKPCSGGTNMSQEKYMELRQFCKEDEILTEEAAKEKISYEFGFAKEKITILKEVCTYESNKHGRMRVKDTYERQPLYNATDWNYIRFNCAGWQYEMIDGGLYMYND